VSFTSGYSTNLEFGEICFLYRNHPLLFAVYYAASFIGENSFWVEFPLKMSVMNNGIYCHHVTSRLTRPTQNIKEKHQNVIYLDDAPTAPQPTIVFSPPLPIKRGLSSFDLAVRAAARRCYTNCGIGATICHPREQLWLDEAWPSLRVTRRNGLNESRVVSVIGALVPSHVVTTTE